MQLVEPRSFKVGQELAVQEKPVCGHAYRAKTEGFCVTDQLYNIRMLERFAPLKTDTEHAELPDVVNPLLEIGHCRMRDRVVELVAIMAIQVALLGHIEVRNPRLGVENPKNLLEIDHSRSFLPLQITASTNQASA